MRQKCMNTMMNTRSDFNLVRVHIVSIAMSPIQGGTVGTERVTSCIRLLMSGMPTGPLFWPATSSRVCRRASSTT